MTNNIRLIDLKTTKIRACTIRNEDGSYLTVINSRMAGNVCREAYAHEMEHISGDDFDRPDADTIEHDRHKRRVRR